MHMLIIKTAADVHLFAASKEYRKNARAEFLKVVHNYVIEFQKKLTWNEIWNYIPDNFWPVMDCSLLLKTVRGHMV